MVGTSLTFLTPLGAVLALGVIVPLLALLAVRRRAHRVRRVVGLEGAAVRRLAVPIAALVAAGALLGTAAAQPVLERTSDRHVRTDAEVFVVIDVSRSMLAQERGSPTRLERTKTTAADLRAALADVPVGVASLTDRVLPHLFPSADVDVFNSTLDRSIGIERPPPASSLSSIATNLDSLRSIRSLRFFRPTAERKLLVVFTDGESQPVARARLAALFRQPPVIEVIFVHVWGENERVYSRGVPEVQYRPDPSSRLLLDGIAASLKGAVFTDRSLGAITDRARRALGEGPTVTHGQSRGREALAPYLAIVAFLPLGLLLWRPDR